jgi:adenylate cyclase
MPERLPALFQAIIKARRSQPGQAAFEADLWQRFGTTCAMLVLDSTGFTRTVRAHGIVHFLDLFLRMRAVAGRALEAQNCLAWRSAADNLFAEFPGPDAALAAALAAHQAVAAAELRLSPGEPYRVCIGIGYGRVLQGGRDGVFGDEMNLACKLGEDIAEGGETLLTEAAYRGLTRRKSTVFERREATVSGNTITYHAVRR